MRFLFFRDSSKVVFIYERFVHIIYNDELVALIGDWDQMYCLGPRNF